ncbi:pheromone-regulated DUP240 protein prm9 [Saccharomyces cerevisiae]|nr:pheromone-regulated DUP240 protein prm9 [Saccharomyces cerevisiae]
MNQYLFDHGLWNTPYRFYDEEDCHRYFLHLIEGKTFKKQGDPPTSNVTDAQSNDETAGTPNEAIEFFTFHSGPNYQKYLSKAAEIEQQAQNNYWQGRHPDIDAHL